MVKTYSKETREKSRQAVAIADAARSLLAGRLPEVQGAALADLTTQWVLGHHPDDRAMILETHYQAVRAMLATCKRRGIDPWRNETDPGKH